MLWWECKYLSIWWFLGASQCFLLVDFKSEIIICMRSMEKLQWSGNWKLQILVELLNFECDRKFWIVSTVGMCVCKAMCLCVCVCQELCTYVEQCSIWGKHRLLHLHSIQHNFLSIFLNQHPIVFLIFQTSKILIPILNSLP